MKFWPGVLFLLLTEMISNYVKFTDMLILYEYIRNAVCLSCIWITIEKLAKTQYMHYILKCIFITGLI